MSNLNVLQAEIARWETELSTLDDERTAEGWTEPEKLLYTLQRTVATYRALAVPAIPDSDASRALATYCEILADEIAQLVDTLDEQRIELIRFGETAELQLQATETLAALRALGRVVLRFGHDPRSSWPETVTQMTA